MWVEFVCWLSPLLREVFLRVLRFSPLLKNQYFQIPIRPGIRYTKNKLCGSATSKAVFILFIYYVYFYDKVCVEASSLADTSVNSSCAQFPQADRGH